MYGYHARRPKLKGNRLGLKAKVLFLALVMIGQLALANWPAATLAGLNSWTTTGPVGGDVAALAVSPNYANDHIVMAGTPGGTLWRSTDGGATWTPSYGAPAAFGGGITQIAFSSDFANDDTVFVGVWYVGVFKSTDGGLTWARVLDDYQMTDLAISPQFVTDQTLYAGTWGGGIRRSTNGGASWTTVYAPGGNKNAVSALATVATSPTAHTVFAGTRGGVVKSTNAGANWADATLGLPNNPPGVYYDVQSFAFPGTSDTTIVAGVYGPGAYKSTDGGTTWASINNGPYRWDLPVYVMAAAPAASNDTTIFAGTHQDGILASNNLGSSWSPANSDLGTSTVRAIAVSPDFANDSTMFTSIGSWGVFKSTNGGASWTSANLIDWPVGALAVSPRFATDKTVFAGGYILWQSTDTATTWRSLGRLGNALAIAPSVSIDTTVFVAEGWAFVSLNRASDGGYMTGAYVDWSRLGDPNFGVRALAVSPDFINDRTVYAATSSGMYETTDGGDWMSWHSRGLSAQNISALAVSPNFAVDHTLFAAASGVALWKSTDRGVNWANSGFTGRASVVVALSPNYAADATLFAGVSGEGVYKSSNNGASWNLVSAGLTSTTTISAVAVSPNFANDQIALVATNGGVFKTANGGAYWRPFNAGLTASNVNALAFSPDFANDNLIFASTSSGVFKQNISPPATTPPVTDILISTQTAGGGWYNTTPTVTLIPDKEAKTLYSWDTTPPGDVYTAPLQAQEGSHTVYYFSHDPGDNIEATKSRGFKVDLTPPTAFSIDATSPTRAPLVALTPSTDTLSGLDKYQLYVDGVLDRDNIAVDATSTTPLNWISTGTHQFKLAALDKAGNKRWSNAIDVVVDNAGPAAFWLYKPDHLSWVTAQPEFIWKSTYDWWAGLANYRLYVDGVLVRDNIPTAPYYDWEAIDPSTGWPGVMLESASATAPLTAGWHEWTIMAVDNLGNPAFADGWGLYINVDPTAPVDFSLLAPPSGSWRTTDTPVLSWQAATDGESGLSKQQLFVDGALDRDNLPTDATQTTPATPLPEGVHTWYVKARDVAGNNTTSTQVFTVNIDTIAPAGLVTVNAGALTVDSFLVNLSLSANDAMGSGLGWMRFSNDDGSWSDWAVYGTSRVWALTSGDGNKTVFAQFKDMAGNISNISQDSIILSTPPPPAPAKQQIATKLSLSAKPKAVAAGKATLLKGKLRDSAGKGLAGKRVKIKLGKKVIKTLTTAAGGNFKLRHKPKKKAIFKAVFAGDADYLSSTSKAVTVKIKL